MNPTPDSPLIEEVREALTFEAWWDEQREFHYGGGSAPILHRELSEGAWRARDPEVAFLLAAIESLRDELSSSKKKIEEYERRISNAFVSSPSEQRGAREHVVEGVAGAAWCLACGASSFGMSIASACDGAREKRLRDELQGIEAARDRREK